MAFLSREEYGRLYAAISNLFPEHLAEFIVSVHTGMRLSEQYSLTWSQVHFDRRSIDLTKTKNGSARTGHLNASAIEALESVRVDEHPKGKVFPRNGKDFDTRSWFHPCLKEAGVTGYVWHCNRHTFCSWLAMAGATIKEIQEAAGHKTISMAARYSHLSPAHRLSIVERIAGQAPEAPGGAQQAPEQAPVKKQESEEEGSVG